MSVRNLFCTCLHCLCCKSTCSKDLACAQLLRVSGPLLQTLTILLLKNCFGIYRNVSLAGFSAVRHSQELRTSEVFCLVLFLQKCQEFETSPLTPESPSPPLPLHLSAGSGGPGFCRPCARGRCPSGAARWPAGRARVPGFR